MVTKSSERILLAVAVASSRGRAKADSQDYELVDRFLNSNALQEHDRRVACEAIQEAAFQIPDTIDALQHGESATHWLSRYAVEVGEGT